MRKIGGLLLLIGIGCLLYSFYIEEKQKEDINQLQSALEAIQNTDNLADSESIKEEVSSSLNIDETDLSDVLTLTIPSINLEAPVLPETTQESLDVALTQIKTNQVPGQDNFTIAGHNSAVYGRHFNRLSEVGKGDVIYLIDGNNEFVYQVQSKNIINPQEVEVLNDTPGKREITLITCTLSGTKRIAVKGQLISSK